MLNSLRADLNLNTQAQTHAQSVPLLANGANKGLIVYGHFNAEF